MTITEGKRPEIFSGTIRLSAAMAATGLNILPDIEIAKGKNFDVMRPSCQRTLLRWLKEGRVWYVHFGTPCCVWSRARHNIRDWRRARQKETLGVGLALFTARALRLCLALNIKFSVENPQNSRLWEFGPINDILAHKSVYLMTTHMCAWGMNYKKPTSIMTNFEALLQLQARCKGGHVHEQLRGSQTVEIDGKRVTRNRTAAAGAYPWLLCEAWARVVKQEAPDSGCGRASCHDVGLFLAALAGCLRRRLRG